MHSTSWAGRRHRPAAFISLVLLGLAGLSLPARAICPPASSPVLLVIHAPDGRQHHCDRAALDALPRKSITTRLPDELGMPGRHTWTGIPLQHIARALGAHPDADVQLRALNHYAVRIPASDLQRFDPVVATRRNGVALALRKKGPLFLIYPFEQQNELSRPEYVNRSIWQIHEIRLR